MKSLFALIYQQGGSSKPIFLKHLDPKEYETTSELFSTPYLSVQLATATRIEGKDEWILDSNPYYKIVLTSEQPDYVGYKLQKIEDGQHESIH